MYDEEQEVYTPVHKSLIKDNLFMGCNPKLLMMVGSVSMIFVVILQGWVTITLGIAMFLLGIPVLRSLAKKDPYLDEVYLIYLRYSRHYDANSSQSGRLLTPYTQYEG